MAPRVNMRLLVSEILATRYLIVNFYGTATMCRSLPPTMRLSVSILEKSLSLKDTRPV